VPFLGDLARMLRAQGPVSWDAARQFAIQVASGGTSEPNVDPMERIRLQELVRVAELRVAQETGLPISTGGRMVTIAPVSRTEWAGRTLDAWRPLLERLAQSLSGRMAEEQDDEVDPSSDAAEQFVGGLMRMVAPMMLGMQAGAMVGHLALRSLGQYDLPVPRPVSDELILVAPNITAFGDEWSLPADELRLWICLNELTHHAVLSTAHVRERLLGLLLDYAGGFVLEPSSFEEHLEGVDPTDPASLQRILSDPRAMLGAIQSPEQQALQPQIEALVVVIEGYVDHVMEQAGTSLISSYGMLTEALHRRRVEAASADRFVEQLLGLELGRSQYERGQVFIAGVFERGGAEALERLWRSPRELPTPAEVDAPGLWLARIDLPDLAD